MRKNLTYKTVILLLAMLFFVGCTRVHHISMVDFYSDEVLIGVFDERDDSVTVTMLNGEILKGNYSSLDNDNPASFYPTFGYSSGRHHGHGGSFGGIGIGFNFGGTDTVKYALLSSETSELKMEIQMTIRSWSKDGFGEAKTNDGRVYKIQF